MRSFLRAVFVGALLMGAMVAAGSARAADALTIYRCVDSKGGISLQDQPCPKDAHQAVRQMTRPQDAPPRQIAMAAHPPQTPAVEVRVIHDREPLPTYECRTPDGQTYTNQTGVPGGRYVPLWTYGYGGIVGRGGRPGSPAPSQPLLLPASTWQQDTCVRLRQNEACHLLHDRRDELGTRIFNAQGSDRDRYEHEQRSVDDQLRSDCSGY